MHSAGLSKTLVKLLLSTRLLTSDLILCRPFESISSMENITSKLVQHGDESLNHFIKLL